jgi:AAA domain
MLTLITISLGIMVMLYFCIAFELSSRKMNKPTLYILRGIPGSGKSTLAQQMASEKGIDYFEADQYFMIDGEYRFDINHLMDAHEYCLGKVSHDIRCGLSVIVSNTFSRWRQMRPYIDVAQEYGYHIEIIECVGDFGSIHAVPTEKMAEFRKNLVDNDQFPRIENITYSKHIPVAQF